MIILGLNSDDKGKQLETLTKRILEYKGFSNIRGNMIAAGGQELDLIADYSIPIPGNSQTERIIVECKACKEPVDLPAWLKFIGKIYIESKRLRAKTRGLFVALSGVNGNVTGSYDDLRQHDTTITLLSGDDLLESVAAIYGLSQRSRVLGILRQFTLKNFLEIEPVYYEGRFLWLVTFPGGEYTALQSSGDLIANPLEDDWTSMIRERLEVTKYVDLKDEAKVREALVQTGKMLVAKIADSGGECPTEELLAISHDNPDMAKKALKSLKECEWLEISDSRVRIIEIATNDPDYYPQFGKVLQFMFDGMIAAQAVEMFFNSSFVMSHLNEKFAEYVSVIQGNLPLTAETKGLISGIARLSPSACLYCMTPEPLIVNHRNKAQGIGEKFDEEDAQVLKRGLVMCLTRDYEQPTLSKFYYEKTSLREIELWQRMVVKSKKNIEFNIEAKLRKGLGQLAPSLGGRYIHLLILGNAPQPWESGGIGFNTQETVDKSKRTQNGQTQR